MLLPPENSYVPLWCKTAYSFLEGASHPDELIEEAYRLGIRALAVTDRDGVYGIVRAHVVALELGIQLIVGAQITLDDNSQILLLAQTRAGYANLCRLISKGRLRCLKGESRVTWQEVCEHADGLIALWGGPDSLLTGEVEPVGVANDLRDAFGDRLYAMLVRHHEAREALHEFRLRERGKRHGLSTVAAMEVLYHAPDRRELQDVLTCIRHGVTLPRAGRLIRQNAEHALRPPRGFARLYDDDPDSVYRTREVAERCTFSLSEIRYRYPLERLPDGTSPAQWLRELTFEGARERYPQGVPPDVAGQIEKELSLIHELQYEGYFLTMREIVRYCRHHDILCQGRGSAANSAVCYALGVTAVDPVRMGLLFERFLSRERAEPPDIDLDIEHDRREEVIQHVYKRYGRTHAAMVANFIRYRSKSAVRDVGKALALPETTVERVARLLSSYEFPAKETVIEAGLDLNHPTHLHLLRLLKEIQDFPRHLSIHPGGFLLGHEAVHDLVPIENATMPDRTVIQWDKNDVEDLGLFKVDLLGLGALNVTHRALDLIEKHHGERFTLATIPADDDATFEMIRAADTVGVFQIESRAQMSMLPRLGPRNYYDIVIQVSIVRPGPITGGMVHPYLRRRSGEEEVVYPHPSLEPILKKTLGIPLFQEQVMQLAIVAADYTPGEADRLRRDMAAWRQAGRIERHRERLISRMVRKGIERQFAEQVFEQIRGFGEYGFPESHAASFALIAYATSWLRCHFPAAYLCAMLNAQPMGFYSAATLVQDGIRHEVTVLPIDIHHSDWDCTLTRHEVMGTSTPPALRMGLRYVKGLHKNDAQRLLNARAGGPFPSLNDLATRAGLTPPVLTRLAEAGALAAFDERRDALWNALAANPDNILALESATEARFDPLNPYETINWDYAFTSHSTHGHPLAPIREQLAAQGLPDAAAVRATKDGQRIRYAGMVICRQRPGTAHGVVFMTLEDETGFVNLVVWQKVFEKFHLLATTQSFLGVTGRLQSQSNTTHLVVEELWVPKVDTSPQQVAARDFH